MKNRILKICLVLISVLIVWGVYVVLKPEPKTIAGLMESYENPGIKIKIRSPFSGTVLVAKKGEVIFKEAYGLSNRETNEENEVDTKYGIGSVTKQFTAMLVMQLVEEGKLKLQDTIGYYLPYLPEEKANHITIHQLLTHTSGLAHYFALPAIGVNLSDFRKTKYTPKELVQLIGKTNMIAKPGEQFYYSSLGYDVLGAIIEEVSGKPFADFLDEKIVKPLQLKNTGFASNEYISNELAKGYAYREVYGLDWWTSEHGGEIREAPFRDQSTAYAAGGMHSTVEDLFIWSEAIKSHKLLSPELTKIMLSPDKKGHCYGWVRNWDDIVEKNINARLYGHGGALTGNSAYIGMYDDGTTIIYLANINNLKAEEILHQLYLRANDLKDDYKLKGYPNRSSYEKFIAAGGMTALKDYFQRLSEYSGYTVNPSNSTMRGVMKIHLEAGKQKVADSLKTVFLNTYNPNETTINDFGYDFLYSDNSNYALQFFIENTKRYPFSSNVWDSLGEAYLTYKDYDSAIDCYKKAVELGEQVNHRSLEDYKENLKKAESLNKS
ncbi:serine hydrolase [Pontimicrobium sp. IMCC45349]|uniref:serine hydrolase domain-containing protein n=1 Tax=Pontimicrobium sp. IMCC45349 TaxID=3391574 RepID=UPI0039A2A38E